MPLTVPWKSTALAVRRGVQKDFPFLPKARAQQSEAIK